MAKTGISRRKFLGASAGALAVPSIPFAANSQTNGGSGGTSTSGRPNVLFIMSDDLCTRLGPYRHPVVRTPNFDRLARMGVTFNHAYCQYPLCSPARTALMTGLAPDTTKIYDLGTHFRTTVPDAVTLPQAFINSGYFSARAGKIYHYQNPTGIGTSGLDDSASWHETINPGGIDHTKEEQFITMYTPQGGRGQGAGRGQFARGGRGAGGAEGEGFDGANPPFAKVPGPERLGGSICGYPSPSKPELHTDSLVADAIIEAMQKHRNDPWFLGAGFYKPHVPWVVPSKFYDMYPLSSVDVIPFRDSEMQVAPRWAYTSMDPNHGMSEQQQREAIRAYYAALTFVDANLGRLIDAVEHLGFARNTIIVFASDHGWCLGEHGQWEKQMLFEQSARVPFFIGGHGVQAAGRVCQRTVEHLDIYPTLVEMCGLQGAQANLQGQSLAPLLTNPDGVRERPAASQVLRGGQGGNRVMGYSIRTEQYRYTYWSGGTQGENEELYDYNSDPNELQNLAKTLGVASVKAQLRNQLEQISMSRGMPNSFAVATANSSELGGSSA